MELWATGFNAWGQLQFESQNPDLLPHDLTEFRCILRSTRIELVSASVSATLVRTSKGCFFAGIPDEFNRFILNNPAKARILAVAGNNKIILFDSTTISQYPSPRAFLQASNEDFSINIRLQQIVANQTSFTALSSSGQVYTWGDERYSACLGRDITEENLACRPSLVEDLSDLPSPIVKISSGGYATAVLTASHDVYFWGRSADLPELLNGAPTPLDLKGRDIVDVAVGFSHLIVLTTEGEVFVVGDGGNGQLGLGVAKLEDWQEVVLSLKDGQTVTGVFAGYKTTFLLIEDTILKN